MGLFTVNLPMPLQKIRAYWLKYEKFLTVAVYKQDIFYK